MNSNKRLIVSASSVDMTLMLAAESYLRARLDPSEMADPTGDHALSDLIDLVVNSDVCFLTLPSAAEYAEQPVLVERLHRASALKLMPKAAVALKRSVERKIAKAFWPLVESLGRDWLAQWWKSHFANPVVRRHYLPRLGEHATEFGTISDDGWEYWKEFLAHAAPEIAFAPFKEPWLRQDVRRAGSLSAYQYAYTYDVFRRGWQYAEAARRWPGDEGIKYCPHQLRHAALIAASDGWLEAARAKYWSWGRYIGRVVATSSKPVHPEQIADWIVRLREADVPRWISVKSIRPEVLEQLEVAARRARIPRIAIAEPSARLRVAASAGKLASSALSLDVVEAVVSVLPASKVLDRATFHLSETGKSLANLFQKGRFGRPGLLRRRRTQY